MFFEPTDQSCLQVVSNFGYIVTITTVFLHCTIIMTDIIILTVTISIPSVLHYNL